MDNQIDNYQTYYVLCLCLTFDSFLSNVFLFEIVSWIVTIVVLWLYMMSYDFWTFFPSEILHKHPMCVLNNFSNNYHVTSTIGNHLVLKHENFCFRTDFFQKSVPIRKHASKHNLPVLNGIVWGKSKEKLWKFSSN